MLNHTIPAFPAFARSIARGSPEAIRGLYVDRLFALPVIQQPNANPAYVSAQEGVVTLFSLAARHGVSGFLAHSYLSGRLFYDVPMGAKMWVVRGDGSFSSYRAATRAWFQKLSPYDSHSDYLDQKTREVLTTGQLFERFYTGKHLTLQTCVESGSIPTWGLMFVIAQPTSQIYPENTARHPSAWV